MRPALALAAITAFGLALRLAGIDARLSHDEGYSWLVATAPSVDAFLDRLAATENTPPLFYALLAPLPLTDEVWLRLPSLVAGTLWVPATFALVRTLASGRAALLAALMVAVAPYAVSFSDYSRAFMLAGLFQLLAVLAVARLLAGAGRRWAVLFVFASTAALYCEYYALALHVVLGTILVLHRRRWAVPAALPLLLFAPWAGELQDSIAQLGETKAVAGARVGNPLEVAAALAFGEHGAVVVALQALAVLAVVAWAFTCLRGHARRLLGGAVAGVVGLHLLVSLVAGDLLRQRYLTILIPLAAAAVAIALPRRLYLPAAAVLVAAGVVIGVNRLGREYEPEHERAVAAARDYGATTILTNSAVIAFYGRDLDVVLDRPFGLGPGEPERCRGTCVFIDDPRYGGVRPTAPGTATSSPGGLTVGLP